MTTTRTTIPESFVTVGSFDCDRTHLHPRVLLFENLMLEFEFLGFNPKTLNVKMLNPNKNLRRLQNPNISKSYSLESQCENMKNS
jgi:hypothetical protein